MNDLASLPAVVILSWSAALRQASAVAHTPEAIMRHVAHYLFEQLSGELGPAADGRANHRANHRANRQADCRSVEGWVLRPTMTDGEALRDHPPTWSLASIAWVGDETNAASLFPQPGPNHAIALGSLSPACHARLGELVRGFGLETDRDGCPRLGAEPVAPCDVVVLRRSPHQPCVVGIGCLVPSGELWFLLLYCQTEVLPQQATRLKPWGLSLNVALQQCQTPATVDPQLLSQLLHAYEWLATQASQVPIGQKTTELGLAESTPTERAIAPPESGSAKVQSYLPISSPTSSKPVEDTIPDRTGAQLFEQIFNQAAVGILQSSLTGLYIRTNQRFVDMVQYTADELQHIHYASITHPDDVDTDLAASQEVANGIRSHFSLEKRYIRKDGSFIWVHLTLSLLRDEEGQPESVIGVVQDIHDRKMAEAALLRNEARLRILFENIPVLVNAKDDAGNIIVWNQECERTTGYAAEEVVGKPDIWAKLYPNADYLAQQMALWQQRGNMYRNWEWDLVGKDGRVKTISWSSVSDVWPIPGWAAWGIGVDVSDRKQGEQLLRLRTQQQRIVAQLSQQALAGAALQELMQAAAQFVAQGLQVEYCKILELCDEHTLVFRAVQGWPWQELVGTHMPISQESLSGYVLLHNGQRSAREKAEHGALAPIVLEDLQRDHPFLGSRLFQDYGIVSGISIAISGRDRPVGVITACSPQPKNFADEDQDFLQAIANILATAVHRQQRDRELENQAEILQAIIDHVPVMLLFISSTGKVELINAALEQTLGWTKEEYIHNDILYYCYPNLQEYERSLAWVSESTGQWMDFKTVTRDRRVLDTSWANIRLADGSVIGIGQDITARKQVEEQLRRNQAQLSEALSMAQLGYWEYYPESQTVCLSVQFQTLLGINPSSVEPLILSFSEFLHQCIHPLDRALFVVKIGAALQQPNVGSFDEFEHRALHVDDYELDVLVRLRWLHDDATKLKLYGTMQNISDRKLAEREIRRLNTQLELLVEQRTAELTTFFNALPDYIMVVERDTMTIPFCNDLMARAVGAQSRKELEGKTIRDWFSSEELAHILEQNRHVFETGETLHLQEAVDLPEGKGHLDTYKIPLKRPNGQVYALIASSRNITELVEARRTLTERTIQLEAINHELESFSYSVSHDLRAPLRHINGFVMALRGQLATTDAIANPKVLHYLNIIEQSSHKMGQLIDGLLTLSRIGRRRMGYQPVALNPLVTRAIALSNRHAPDTAETTIDEPIFIVAPLPTVLGDEDLLQQVFTNLLSNAVKFSRGAMPPCIEVGSLDDNTIFVRDNGVGFSMEYADEIFGAFQRLHSQQGFEGNGIGLAIVQRIVHRHGGHIWVESEPQKGTCFYLRLTVI
ncbi:PAS domain S-box protein [Leptolyngbya sp. AN02str]|uniref:PAS domain S-box protein n=1 Tax=Leptolyngbya sp. AN02str TaxID=3423363 RepID=UPI003D319D5C